MKVKDVCWIDGKLKGSVSINLDDGGRIAILHRSKKENKLSTFYLHPDEGFWEAGEGFDIRNHRELDIDVAICLIKSNATFILTNEDLGI